MGKFVLKRGIRKLLQTRGEVKGRVPPPAAPLDVPSQLSQEFSSTLRQDASGILGWTSLFCREPFAPKCHLLDPNDHIEAANGAKELLVQVF